MSENMTHSDERLRKYAEAAMEAEHCVPYRGEECVSHARYPWTEHGCSIAVSMSRAMLAVADAEQAQLREERVTHIGDDSIRSMELKGERKRAEALEHALAEAEAEVARQYHEAQQAEARVARVETLAAWFESQHNWREWGIHSQIRAALGDPGPYVPPQDDMVTGMPTGKAPRFTPAMHVASGEVEGKPSHGWTCDCDECSEPS